MKLDESKILYDRSREVFPGGVNSPVRAFGAVGAPKERPSAQASCTARITGSQPCPRIQGPQEST